MTVLLFEILFWVNTGIVSFIGLLYLPQVVYTILGLFQTKKHYEASSNHKYAILISARNEENVISSLIESMLKQQYPKELIDIFVIADNCTDRTAEVARLSGAIVYERFNKEQVGKGYALDVLINNIFADYPQNNYEAFIFFDADNVAKTDFVLEMNKMFDKGYLIAMGYRSSKNFGDNLLTMGHAISFHRECRFMHGVRDIFGSDTYVNGTGFMAACSIFRQEGGYKYHCLTEDVEFGLEQSLKGKRVGYNRDAIFYDEQPTRFRDSFNQRVRWIKGQMQCFKKYSVRLLKRFFTKGEFAGFDLMMHVFPGHLVGITWTVIYHTALFVIGIIHLSISPYLLYLSLFLMAATILFVLATTFMIGLLTVICESSRIKAGKGAKLLAVLTFPFFMFTYVPVVLCALFKKVEWKQIPHNVIVDVDKL